jgi:hypothetical protein
MMLCAVKTFVQKAVATLVPPIELIGLAFTSTIAGFN